MKGGETVKDVEVNSHSQDSGDKHIYHTAGYAGMIIHTAALQAGAGIIQSCHSFQKGEHNEHLRR